MYISFTHFRFRKLHRIKYKYDIRFFLPDQEVNVKNVLLIAYALYSLNT